MWQRLERARTVLQIILASATICGAIAIGWKSAVPAWLTVLLVAASAVGGFLVGRRNARALASKFNVRPPEFIDAIAFKHAEAPTKHGWRITQDDVTVPRACRLTLQSDSEVGQYVRVDAEPGSRLEYPLQPSCFTSDVFHLQYKPERGSAFYVRCHACGKGPECHYWIQYQIGRDRPQPFPPSKGHEWTVYQQPSLVNEKWLTLHCDVAADFKATFGRDGLEFDHFSLFRVRGSLSISAIRLCSAQLSSQAAHG